MPATCVATVLEFFFIIIILYPTKFNEILEILEILESLEGSFNYLWKRYFSSNVRIEYQTLNRLYALLALLQNIGNWNSI